MDMKEYPAKEIRREPTHPGEVLSEVLPALNLSVAEAAQKLGVTRQTLHRIIRGQTAVTPEMAVRLGKFCGNGPNLWLSMQHGYDLWHAQRKLAAAIHEIPTMKQA
jgi:addiction module HigA family antidote